MLKIKKNFAKLNNEFFSEVKPKKISNPYLIHINQNLKELLGLNNTKNSFWLELLSGNKIIEKFDPISSVYAGHQFGIWVPKLGDGRAVLIAEHLAPDNLIYEFQLKGCGLTPFSRMGDGLAVLRSSIREYLCSHTMQNLVIPSTGALAIIGSNQEVYRETVETAAIVLRVARSFIRFGHFEYFNSINRKDLVIELAKFVIKNYYPEVTNLKSLFEEIIKNTAATIAKWQAIGFCHGVMNTDNMSILALTIDYGPFAFLDQFKPNYIFNLRYIWSLYLC